MELDRRDIGFLLGILVGEGHFGGDGRQPQITVRMHVRHHDTLDRLHSLVPGSRLYGPYEHGERRYYQFMVRGDPLRGQLVALLREHHDLLGSHAQARFDAMCERYGL